MKLSTLFIKYLSVSLCIAFFSSNVLFAYSHETNLWDQRRKAVQALKDSKKRSPSKPHTVLAQLKNLPAIGYQKSIQPLPPLPRRLKQGDLKRADNDLGLSRLISQLSVNGVIRDIRLAKHKKPVLVYIQDIHGQWEAQKNIGAMVLKILNTRKNTLVGLEGSAGQVPIQNFRKSSTEINKEVGSFFLNTGLITGAEYAGFAAKTTPHLFGVEDKELYLKNVDAVRAALHQQKEKLGALEKSKTRLQLKKQSAYTPTLLALDQRWRAYQDGSLNLGDYLGFLKSQFPAEGAYPTLSLFLKTQSLETSLNFEKAERERNRFLTMLVDKLNKTELNQLVERSVDFRSGGLTYPDYYHTLKETAGRAGIQLSETPEFNRYMAYVHQADSIKPKLLLAEVSQYEKEVWTALCQSSEQKEIYRSAVKLGLEEKLIRLSLTPRQWREYQLTREGEKSSPFESFYEIAEARNKSLASNFKERLSSSRAKFGVLVAGGFHSEGISQLLTKDEYTLITVSPKLTVVEGVKDNEYLEVFTRDKTPLEKLFQSPQISLVEPLSLNPIGPQPKAGVVAFFKGFFEIFVD